MKRKILPTEKNGFWLLCTALFAAGMVLAIYFVLGIVPFGDRSVVTGDLGGQYLPYFAHYSRSWTQSMTYGLDKGLGGNLIGLFAYYVSSPLNLVYLFADPASYSALAGGVLAAKLIAAAVSFCFYLNRKFSGLGGFSVPLALCYGFMAYNLVYAQNIMWLDGVILLPLVLWQVDKLVFRHSMVPLILLLALLILANFYVGYMICLFSALYLCWLLAQQKTPGKDWMQALGRLLLCGAVAALVSGFLLLPAILDAQGTKGGLFEAFLGGFNYQLRMLPSRFTFAPFLWEEIEAGAPNVYCGCLALVLGLCFFFSDKISARKKIAGGGLLLVMVFSSWISDLDTIWHGFKRPVWFPCRYSFLISFTLLLLAAQALHYGLPRIRRLAWAGLAGIGGGVYVYFVRLRSATEQKLILTAAICGLFLLVLFLLRRRPRRWMRAACLLAVTCVTAAELSAAGAVTLRKFEEYTDSGYREFVLSGSETVLAVQQADGGSYRMEKNFYRTFNDPMLLGYFGTSHYGSTQKEEEQGLLIRLGYCPNLYANGASVASDALLGIRYLFTRPGEGAPNAVVLQREDITAPWTVWQNPYALPLVQLCSDRWLDQALPEDPFGFQNALFSALTGEETLVQQPVEIREGADGLTFTCPRDGIYSFVAFDGQTGELQINGSARGDYFGLFTPSGSVQELGRYAAGEQVTVSVGGSCPPSAQVFWLDEAALGRISDEKAAQPVSFEIGNGGIQAKATAEKGQMLFCSVPYESGWSAKIDGERAQTENFGGFLALVLPQGEHQIELSYRPAGSVAGAGMTVIGILCTALLAGKNYFAEKRRRIG